MSRPGRDGSPDEEHRRVALTGHVDRPAVERAHAAVREDGVLALDLASVRSWDRDALTPMTRLIDGAPDGVAVVAPPASSFLGVLDAADLRQVWAVYDEVRRLRLAAGGPAVRDGVVLRRPTSGPPAPRSRAFGPSRAAGVLQTLGAGHHIDEEEP